MDESTKLGEVCCAIVAVEGAEGEGRLDAIQAHGSVRLYRRESLVNGGAA